MPIAFASGSMLEIVSVTKWQFGASLSTPSPGLLPGLDFLDMLHMLLFCCGAQCLTGPSRKSPPLDTHFQR